jgi:hypothetical protein
MKSTMLTVGLLSALSLAVPAASRADIHGGVTIRFGDSRDRGAWRYGYDRGTNEGYREGERDARRHERFDYRDEGRYRDSDRGYKRWMGPRYEYSRGYRQGFAEAYTQAYRRFAWNGRYDRRPYDHYSRYGRDDRF